VTIRTNKTNYSYVGGAADADQNAGLSQAAVDFQRWKKQVTIGKYTFDTDAPNSFAPRDEWKDRDLDPKHIETLKKIVQEVGSTAEKSIWVIDSKELRRKFSEVGMLMFTKEFCTGIASDQGLDPASPEEIVAWVEKQRRERIAGNHTLSAAKQLRKEFPSTLIFQTIVAEIWIVDSKLEEDDKKVIYWAAKENYLAGSSKTTTARERCIYFHHWLERLGFFTRYKLDEFGDIEQPKGYFKSMIKEAESNWTLDYTSVVNFLNIARAWGEEWHLLLAIMDSTHKGSKGGSTGAYFHVGSAGVPRQERIVWFSKFLQGLIDTKELKAQFLCIKQVRALKQSTLEFANEFRFLTRETWHSWSELTLALPSLNEIFIETYRSGFKPIKKSRKGKGNSDEIEYPENFKKALVVMFQVQMKNIADAKQPKVNVCVSLGVF
jgi:hypothetical protein